ncbi:hypothetical protein ADEAN_000237600 [Angomonas deanei]|uniref:Uncharacterized protein n=1 Tax=Angomonas deanei TaxID=59799 RepID=A0A7G2C862_9TRYP|nr:hypothetical protein ADEAN_000237600 [Angomonas deanei]
MSSAPSRQRKKVTNVNVPAKKAVPKKKPSAKSSKKIVKRTSEDALMGRGPSPLVRRSFEEDGELFSPEEIAYYSSWAPFSPPDMRSITELTMDERNLLCGVQPGSDRASLFQYFEDQFAQRYLANSAAAAAGVDHKAQSWPAKGRMDQRWAPLSVPDSIISSRPSTAGPGLSSGARRSLPSPPSVKSYDAMGTAPPSAVQALASGADSTTKYSSVSGDSVTDGTMNPPPWVTNTNKSKLPGITLDLDTIQSASPNELSPRQGTPGSTSSRSKVVSVMSPSKDEGRHRGRGGLAASGKPVGTNTISRKFGELENDLEELLSPGAGRKKGPRASSLDTGQHIGANTINRKLNALEDELGELNMSPTSSPRRSRPSTSREEKQAGRINRLLSSETPVTNKSPQRRRRSSDGTDKTSGKRTSKSGERPFLPNGRVVVLSLGPVAPGGRRLQSPQGKAKRRSNGSTSLPPLGKAR